MPENIEYISKQDMLDAVDNLDIISSIDGRGNPTSAEDFRMQFLGTVLKVKSADVLPYTIASDGTLTVTVPKGTKRIGRILIEEDGTQYGGLFYPDTGGCFLSSMEKG